MSALGFAPLHWDAGWKPALHEGQKHEGALAPAPMPTPDGLEPVLHCLPGFVLMKVSSRPFGMRGRRGRRASVLEHEEGRGVGDAQFLRDGRVVVHLHLSDDRLPFLVRREIGRIRERQSPSEADVLLHEANSHLTALDRHLRASAGETRVSSSDR